MKRLLLIVGLVLAVLVIGYLAGPSAHHELIKDEEITLDPDLVRLEQTIAESERNASLRPDNEARIIWADSTKKVKTPYSLVYIPGFTASWVEGDPVHRQLAKAFGCNLYLARTAEHGVDSQDALKTMTPASYAASAERALAIGKALGEKVIVIGTSAGGMLSLYLAAHHPEIYGLVLYSPCIATANPALQLVTKPWGKQLMDQIFGGEHVTVTWHAPERAKYWLQTYHTNGLLTLQTMLDEFMTPGQFQKVKQPVFLGYYYKDEANQDKVVSVPAMLAMYDQLGTAVDQKRKVAFPEAGEHVIASHLTSGDVNGVYQATKMFMEQVLTVPLQTDSVTAKAMLPKK
ncbi:alpha/beta hydrolase [Spirosoma sp. KUDC1026]|uniref:alpha/beta hydrolase n=1 Tax=Spirosoma sp. KUDC1026 TaxID=2745947 RepID=UPI00159BA2EA|nr:alpha/beta hydrolase [Spirosoma sp. KUDC1026]QKZ11451.1 alpha/beta hydrolase [Spirosoma sp. KUDC1026]